MRDLQPHQEDSLSQQRLDNSAESLEPADSHGELFLFEFSYRAGLLIGAGLFFHDVFGWPWQRDLFGMMGIVLSVLITLTLMIDWRVLGDWRRWTNQVLIAGFAFVLAFPLAGAFGPQIEGSAIPQSIQSVLLGISQTLSELPGLDLLMKLLRGIIIFTLLAIIFIVLLFGTGNGRRAGVYIVGILVALLDLFFYPKGETVAGFILLALFLASQWNIPLMIPERVLSHLNQTQKDYLRQLLRYQSLSPAETKLYLENRADYFAELLDFNLVHYDQMTREILPGKRLLNDPGAEALAMVLSGGRRAIWVLIGLLYVLLPDLIPGPIDDIIVLAICTGSGFRLFEFFKGTKGRRLTR